MNRSLSLLGALVLSVFLTGCGEEPAPVAEEPATEAPASEGLMFASSADEIVMKEAPAGLFADAKAEAEADAAEEKRETAARAGGSGDDRGGAGILTSDQIQNVVRAKMPQVRACYERELKRHDGLKGKVVLGWTIRPDGSVGGVRVVRNTTRNAEMTPCMLRAVSEWRFPRAAEPFDVEYPFVFKPRDF
jgi:TonB family protein